MKKRRTVSLIQCAVFVVSSVVGLLLGSTLAVAEAMPIGMRAILPENQQSQATYFDLKMSPNQVQTIEIELSNNSEEDVPVHVTVNPGQTNDNGVIIYSESDRDNRLESRKVSLSDITQLDETVTIPARGTSRVPIELTMPSTPFEGMVIGGVYVTLANQEEVIPSEQADNPMAVINKFEYNLGIKLTETDDDVTPDMILKGIKPSQVLSRNTLKVHLENPTPTVIDEIKYEATVYKKNQTEAEKTTVKTDYRLAPTSDFNLGISWGDQPFEAGSYRLVLTANSQKTQQGWEWEEDFEITREEADKLNKQAIGLEEKPFNWMWIIVGVFAAIVLVLLILLSRSKHKQTQEKKRVSRKRKRR